MLYVGKGFQNVLLITATITPKPGTPNISRVDPKERLSDYREALNFYLDQIETTFDHLMFCENSDSDVSALHELVESRKLSDKVTFFVKDGLNYPPHFDRGYGEFKLIDDAMNSIPEAQGSQKVVWKVTGRYIIRNIAAVVRRATPPFDIACNFRNYPKHWIDTYLIAWTPAAYAKHLSGVYDKLKTNVPEVTLGVSAEELLRAYLESRTGLSVLPRFAVTPDVRGVRAADNQSYEDNFNMKYQIRRILNFCLPRIWI